MSYTTADGRQQLLDELGLAIGQIGEALGDLSEAYEHMDEDAGDRLEERLFRPVQAAYGAAKRTHAEFSGRYGFSARIFETPPQSRPLDAWTAIERAAEALEQADETISGLQDSMLPVEVGDTDVRAGLSHVRGLIAPLPARSREVLRTLGR